MAVYLHNNDYKQTKADHVFIRNTEIKELENLRKNGRLALPDEVLLWETTLLLRVARLIDGEILDNGWVEKYSLLKKIKSSLEKYYEERQNPEIKIDIEILKNYELTGKVAKAGGDISGALGRKVTEKFIHFRDLVYAANTSLKNALAKAKYRKRVIVFLDGLDNRSEGINPAQYTGTLASLGTAVWNLNADFFSNIRDTSYRPKIVLLMRPEVVELVGLSNVSLKMRDNAVELNWLVNDEAKYKDSRLFKLVSHIIAAQQADIPEDPEAAWRHYFNFSYMGRDSFVGLLRKSYHRPRDLLSYIEFMRIAAGPADVFQSDHFSAPDTERKFSEYLLAEIRNGLEYSLRKSERDLIPLFFKSFNGKRKVTYQEYSDIHDKFSLDCQRRGILLEGSIFSNKDRLLQLLFENNILAYIEGTSDRAYVRWFFRERTLGDPVPKVEFDVVYVVHDGLSKALDVGAEKKPILQSTRKPRSKKGRSFRRRVRESPGG
jgi:hypothetical protein